MSEAGICISCRKPDPQYDCGVCGEGICKKCEEFLEVGSFSFLEKVPATLTHSHYCPACYQAEVAPALERYNETMEAARAVFVFFTSHKRPPHAVRLGQEKIRVENCDDRDETVLRLAFLAAERGGNALIDAEVVSEKLRIRGGAYQTSRWKGSAFAATIDESRLRED